MAKKQRQDSKGRSERKQARLDSKTIEAVPTLSMNKVTMNDQYESKL